MRRFALVLGVVIAVSVGAASSARQGDDDLVRSFTLTGTVRDFDPFKHRNGHTDFERVPKHGYGHYVGNIDANLGEDDKPVFIGGGGKVLAQWRNASNNPICYRLYNFDYGDTEGAMSSSIDTGAIASAESFSSWYRDAEGVNTSSEATLKFVLQSNGTYVFDDRFDEHYATLGGFFPLDADVVNGLGATPEHNHHFTYEFHATFVHDVEASDYIRFISDDDLWVFINDELVIDLGGVHAESEQYLEMNRLNLEDGETYSLAIFGAQRHTPDSHLRITTPLLLQNAYAKD